MLAQQPQGGTVNALQVKSDARANLPSRALPMHSSQSGDPSLPRDEARSAESYGCVDWFQYDEANHAPPAQAVRLKPYAE